MRHLVPGYNREKNSLHWKPREKQTFSVGCAFIVVAKPKARIINNDIAIAIQFVWVCMRVFSLQSHMEWQEKLGKTWCSQSFQLCKLWFQTLICNHWNCQRPSVYSIVMAGVVLNLLFYCSLCDSNLWLHDFPGRCQLLIIMKWRLLWATAQFRQDSAHIILKHGTYRKQIRFPSFANFTRSCLSLKHTHTHAEKHAPTRIHVVCTDILNNIICVSVY